MHNCYRNSKNSIDEKIYKGELTMPKEPKGQSHYIYDDQGHSQVSAQIMDSYNSGVIDQENGRVDTYSSKEETK